MDILDTCSTDIVTNNLEYVEYVKNCTTDEELTVLRNGGSILFDSKGISTFLTLVVHMNENYVATILSLKDVNNISGVRVTMDTSMVKAMKMILSDRTIFKFEECG